MRAPGARSLDRPRKQRNSLDVFESDLSRLIRDQFDKNGISFKRSMRLVRTPEQ